MFFGSAHIRQAKSKRKNIQTNRIRSTGTSVYSFLPNPIFGGKGKQVKYRKNVAQYIFPGQEISDLKFRADRIPFRQRDLGE